MDKINKGYIINHLNYYFYDSFLSFEYNEDSTDERMLVFKVKLKENPYVIETSLNHSFKQEFFDEIRKFFKEYDLDVNFNNVGNIFWCLV